MELIGLVGAKGCGKTTVANYLKSKGNYQIQSMATPIRDMLIAMGIKPRFLYEDKEEPIKEYGGVTGRYLLQTLGTEWGRNTVCQDIWLKAMRNKLIEQDHDTIIDDIRFPNEVTMVEDLGGYIIYIQRDTAEEVIDTHTSEQLYRNLSAYTLVRNNGNIFGLHEQLNKLKC